jgi:pimeloyl-ACP methyl ester carboxylesterase
VAAPTLLVFGADDLIAPPLIGDRLLARLPNARLEVIPDASHDLEEEQPAFLASLIEAHLRC